MAVGWIKNSADSSSKEIWVYDDIGFWGTNADDFRRELTNIGDDGPLLVRINSGGGDPFDAVAISNLLAARGNVTTQVDGIAASAASIILMGGKTRKMASNAWVMIHNPSIMVSGQEGDLALAIRRLATVRSSLVDTYSKRTGKTKDEVGAWMDAETWFNGEEAKAANVVDEVTDTMTFSASLDTARFKHIPETLLAIHRGQSQPPIVETETSDNRIMNVVKNFLETFKPGPSSRELELVALVEAMEVKADDLLAAKDPKALKLIIDGAITAEVNKQIDAKVKEATSEANGRIVKVSDALKSAGLDPEKLDGLKAAIDQRVDKEASAKALTITAARGIKPVPAEDPPGTEKTKSTLKGRARAAADFDAKLNGASKQN